MRAFLMACLVMIAIAAGAAAVFDIALQQTSFRAFARPSVRN